jgi:hypothetical protein
MTIDLRDHAPRRHTHNVPVPDAPVREVPRARSARRRDELDVRKLGLLVAAIVGVLLLGYALVSVWGYFFASDEAQLQALVEDVGEHILLPEGETPTLATVTDLHALEDQLFFRNAEEGDKVLMYLVSQQAILYRPSIDKIIEVGPITGSTQ